MEWADDIGSGPAAWSYVPVQSSSCSLRVFYRTLAVGKDTFFKVGCFLGFKRVNIQAYADDIVLLSLTVSSLQFLINKISEMLDKHELSNNVRKTVAMIFNRNLNRANKDVQTFYKDDRLNVVSDFKYLGCFMKPDLCEDIDMD